MLFWYEDYISVLLCSFRGGYGQGAGGSSENVSV